MCKGVNENPDCWGKKEHNIKYCTKSEYENGKYITQDSYDKVKKWKKDNMDSYVVCDGVIPKWELDDLDIEKCRQYCYAEISKNYNDYRYLCISCREILENNLLVFQKSQMQLAFDIITLQTRIEKLEKQLETHLEKLMNPTTTKPPEIVK